MTFPRSYTFISEVASHVICVSKPID